MIKLTRFISLFICGIVTISILKLSTINFFRFFDTVSAQTVINSQKIPESIQPCIPKGKSIKRTQVDAIVEYQGKRYYLIGIIEEKPTIFENDTERLDLATIILEDEIGCLVKQPTEKSITHSMGLFVPQPVARILSLEYTKKIIQKLGGKKALLQAYQDTPRDAADSPFIFFPEDAWAYEQLGLELPEPHVIVNRADEVESPKLGIE